MSNFRWGVYIAIVGLLIASPAAGKTPQRTFVKRAKGWVHGLEGRLLPRRAFRRDVAKLMASTPELRQARGSLQRNKRALRLVQLNDRSMKALFFDISPAVLKQQQLYLYLDHDKTFKVAGNGALASEFIERKLTTPRKLRKVMGLSRDQVFSLVRRAAPRYREKTDSFTEGLNGTPPRDGPNRFAPGSAKLIKRQPIRAEAGPMSASPLFDFANSW